MIYKIHITTIQDGTLLKVSKYLSGVMNKSILELKKELSELPTLIELENSDHAAITSQLDLFETVYSIHFKHILSKAELEEEMRTIDLEELEIRGPDEMEVIFYKGTDLSLLIENESLYEEVLKRLRAIPKNS